MRWNEKTTPPQGKGWRRLVVGTATYHYRVGRGGGVVLRSEDGKKRYLRAPALMGISEDSFERGQWKPTSDGSLLPSHVEAFIRAEPS